MKITSLVGVIFVVLAAIYGLSALKDYSAAQCQWTPAVKARFRVSIIFTIVGASLALWGLFFD